MFGSLPFLTRLPRPRSTEFVEEKIEEFLVSFGERLASLSEEAFKTQVTALIKLKECEDAHLGEEVDRNWFEVVTQQYVFTRLNKEVRRSRYLLSLFYKLASGFWVQFFQTSHEHITSGGETLNWA